MLCRGCRKNGESYIKNIALIGATGFIGSAILQEALQRGHEVTVDLPEFPAEYKQGALATREALDMLRKESDLEWSFLSPSADLQPGQRIGKFRLGKDQLLKDAKGESRISIEDYAMAMIDEVEKPKHIRQRFTVGY